MGSPALYERPVNVEMMKFIRNPSIDQSYRADKKKVT